jgi:allantoicase
MENLELHADFTELIDIASEKLGGAALFANDDFFAPKENLLKASVPIFIEGKYTDLGKWMDGWESRRRRTPGFDWCIIRLGLAEYIRGIVVDTEFSFAATTRNIARSKPVTSTACTRPRSLTAETVQWTRSCHKLP